MDEYVLETEDVFLGYEGRTVLEGIRMRVLRGQFWCFLGPNGTGKTTFLRAILGLLDPMWGWIRLHPSIRNGRRIGFVPQRHQINPVLPTTVREFVLLGCLGLRIDRREVRIRLHESLSRCGLEGKDSADFASLSGGQRQRALLARALIRKPSLLILDEPTDGLDVSIEEELLSFLAGLNREEGLTLLVVTHDLSIAEKLSTHVALFFGGRVLSGSREEILTEENLRRAYRLDRRPDGPCRISLVGGGS